MENSNNIQSRRKFRHGDLTFIEQFPGEVDFSGLSLVESSTKIADGELTGHDHNFRSSNAGNQVQVYRVKNSVSAEPTVFQVMAEQPQAISHQEHLTLTIPKGTWKVEREANYDYYAKSRIRAVD